MLFQDRAEVILFPVSTLNSKHMFKKFTRWLRNLRDRRLRKKAALMILKIDVFVHPARFYYDLCKWVETGEDFEF